MTSEKIDTNKNQDHPLNGVSLAGAFWLWGSIVLYAPIYLGIIGFQWIFNAIGALFLTIGLMGALIEIDKMFKNEGFSYFGIGSFFVVPALLIHIYVSFNTVEPIWQMILKIGVLFLIGIGGLFFLVGLPYFFWNPSKKEKESTEEEKIEKNKLNVNTVMSLVIALLTFVTFLLKFYLE
jgi:hypothetical protein